ncbi:hypothetical protein [Spirosoma aerophilum]
MLTFSGQNKLILSCHITGVYDVNRRNTLPDDSFEHVKGWVESISSLNLHGVLFHNNLSYATCRQHESEYIKFVRIAHDTQFNPNVYRYLVYRDFLQTYASSIDSFFVTDISDVVVLNNPFRQPLFLDNPGALFCGDEDKCLDNEWMTDHATHLRSRIADYAAYEATFAKFPLLNCGIIGGNTSIMYPFINDLSSIHQAYNTDNETAYTGDMGAFNYLMRTRYNDHLFHGTPVNTLFKGYQNDRTDCWFRHK